MKIANFGKKLQALREQRNITVSELAHKTGLSRKTIYDWEAGVHQPSSVNTLNIITAFFNIHLDYFLEKNQENALTEMHMIVARIDKLEKRIGELERR